MELTDAQAAHFDAFGFLQLRAFSDAEARAMRAEAEAADPACPDAVERSPLLTRTMVQLAVRRVGSHCRFVVLLVRFIPYLLISSVALFLKRPRDLTLGVRRSRRRCDG